MFFNIKLSVLGGYIWTLSDFKCIHFCFSKKIKHQAVNRTGVLRSGVPVGNRTQNANLGGLSYIRLTTRTYFLIFFRIYTDFYTDFEMIFKNGAILGGFRVKIACFGGSTKPLGGACYIHLTMEAKCIKIILFLFIKLFLKLFKS